METLIIIGSIVFMFVFWGVVISIPLFLISRLWDWITSPRDRDESTASFLDNEFDPAAEAEAEAIRSMKEFDPEAAAIEAMQEKAFPKPPAPTFKSPYNWRNDQGGVKYNAPKYTQLVRNSGIKCLYHFTDRSNLNSIRKIGGLISWQEADRRGIKILRPGGDQLSRELDNRRNLGNYIRLCFHPDHPMKYVAQQDGRMPNPIILEIKLDVIGWKPTMFSDANAAASYSNIGSSFTNLEKLNFNLLKSGNWKSEIEKHQFQAEVLVLKFIHINLITNINRL